MPFAREDRLVEDAYGVLGLARSATEADIRAAWRRAARATHPDAGGDALAFRIAREAFEILTDPLRRAAHDRLLDARAARSAGQRSAGQRVGPQPSGQPAPTPPSARTHGGASSGSTGSGPTAAPGPSPAGPPRSPRAPRAWVPWFLLLANVSLVLRALSLLQGWMVPAPMHDFVYPLPQEGVDLFLTLVGLLGVPLASLAFGSVAIALLVLELGQGRLWAVSWFDASARRLARFVATAAASPLLLGLVLAAVAFIINLVILLLMFFFTLAAISFILWVLSQ
jgi:hypothetical protein